MKRKIILSIALALCFIACIATLCISAANSTTITSKNGLYKYTVGEDKKATIVAYSGTDETVLTISRIDGKYPVGKYKAQGGYDILLRNQDRFRRIYGLYLT